MTVEEKFGERLATTEETVRGILRTVEKQGNNNELLTRLTVVSEMQEARSERQDEQMNKFNDTLNMVNQNLTNLNHTSDQLKNNVGQLGNRMNSIEASQEDSKISVPKLMAKVLVGIVMLIPMLIGAWILLKSGLR